MGQEYDEAHPFQFFTSYADETLKEAVRKGRREEFKDFDFSRVPDPEDEQTFLRSKLDWSQADDNNAMLAWYRQLIALRKQYVMPANDRCCRADLRDGAITMLVPADRPVLRVSVTFSGNQLPAAQGERVMYASDDNAAVTVDIVG
jgi:maltooligosyltrehalose trehalohydrolase